MTTAQDGGTVLIPISHIKLVCVFHCEAVLSMKCASDGHADLSHNRISCFP